LLIVYASLSMIYPSVLLGYHIVLTGTQQTTREFLKHVGHKTPVFTRVTSYTDNIFEKSSFWKNMYTLMLQPRGISLVSARRKQQGNTWRYIDINQQQE
ncbi:hypothetical protein Kpol_1043p45, partial [Vanderwaltozyma polyspora DSM 70294]